MGDTSLEDESIRMDDLPSKAGREAETRQKRTSLANFSAAKLVEAVQAVEAPSIARLRRQNSTGGDDRGGSIPPGSVNSRGAGRRPPGRTLSSQGPRNNRRVKADSDVLSQSLYDNLGRSDGSLDNSGTTFTSAGSAGRKKVPPRTRSMQGGSQRTTSTRTGARRRPDGDDVGMNDMSVSNRRRTPGRSKSGPDGMSASYQRLARPGRRRVDRALDNEEDVVISDSDEEKEAVYDDDIDIDIDVDVDDRLDRSNASGHSVTDRGGRRRIPQRSRSAQDSCLPRGHGGYQRTPRAPRGRRPSNSDIADDASAASGPGFKRSLTGTPPPSGRASGPAFGRSNTTNNPRSARVRGGRDTARELARVSTDRDRDREISPDPGRLSPESVEPLRASKTSMSPVRSRQERRRLREDKEREVMERRLQVKAEMEEDEPEVPEKKEAAWMRRRKNRQAGGDNNDSFNLNDSKSALNADLGAGGAFFPIDPSFGVFPATANSPANATPSPDLDYDDDEYDDDENDNMNKSMMEVKKSKNKLDFSSIS